MKKITKILNKTKNVPSDDLLTQEEIQQLETKDSEFQDIIKTTLEEIRGEKKNG